MNNKDLHQHSKISHHLLDKLSSKISAIKEDLTEAVKDRSRSFSSDRHGLLSSTNSLPITNSVIFTLQDDQQSLLKPSDDSRSLSSIGSSSSASLVLPTRYTTDQMTSNISNLSLSTTASSTSLISSSVNNSSSFTQEKLQSIEDISITKDESIDAVKERFITKIDPVEMTGKSTVIIVPQNSTKRSAILLSGEKFRLNRKIISLNYSTINNKNIYSISIIVGIVSLLITLWKPISSYFSGFIVGSLFGIVIVYIWIRMYLHSKYIENSIEEWIDFPALDSLLVKVDKEDKNTNIQVTGASMSFNSYNADRNDDFIRYPCDIRLDGYRLIIQLASKPWSEEKKSEKEIKYLGCREYLIKEARMILVPELTLTRAKYWMNDYPIVLRNLQILDKQIYKKYQSDKSKLDTNDFFINNATILSIWFETCLQKEEWFHKLSLVLRRGREDIERVNNLLSNSTTSFTSRRQGQIITDTDSSSINIEEFQQKLKNKEITETNLHKLLQSPACLDEVAITINFITRRLLCDMFDLPIFRDLLKTKIEMKLKEIAVSILENFRVVSIDLGNTFPIILKIEPMQWNTQGIWFNLFVYYRGSFKLSVKTRVVLQKLINYDPKKDKPIFAQHHSAQTMHRDDQYIDENDLMHRQKLLAKEPEIAEMVVTRRLGTALTNLALNKYFQIFANLPFVKSLFERFSQEEIGVNVEMTSFSGIVTLNIPPPPSDRIWIGFPDMPDLNIKVIPTYGTHEYSNVFIQDFLSAKIRAELKRLVVLPAMDDQLLPFFRDWALDVIGEIASKPINPQTDNYQAKLDVLNSIREGLQEYKNFKNDSSKTSLSSETTRAQI